MIDISKGIFIESLDLFATMSPYLLFGFFFAGILHVYVSLDMIARHLGKSSLGSVVKAVILGIPLPLCSCGVIPAAVALKKKGASKGAVVSFLIATPITGVDSIFATYSLLGLFFTIFRVIASGITALVSGLLTNLFFSKKRGDHDHLPHEECHECGHMREETPKYPSRIRELFRYAFGQLLGDIWKWLVIGIIIAGIIAYLIPDTFVQKYLGSTWQSMLVMLVIGIPMYICSTGSIPIAASLMLKGMSPGAALVFLLAGPATNAVTITVVSREIGKGATALYVFSIAAMSILMGTLLNLVWGHMSAVVPSFLKPMTMLPGWFETGSAIVLALLIVINIVKKYITRTV